MPIEHPNIGMASRMLIQPLVYSGMVQLRDGPGYSVDHDSGGLSAFNLWLEGFWGVWGGV